MDAGPIAFGTDGWRARLSTFTDERVRAVAQAVADTLRADEPGGEVIVCHDARESSAPFAESTAEVLAGNGFDVVLPERDRPTPIAAYAVANRGARGAVVITASHNPADYNGVKFIPSDAAPALPAVTDRIEANLRAADPIYAPDDGGYGSVNRVDLTTPHARHARQLVARLTTDTDAATANTDATTANTDDTAADDTDHAPDDTQNTADAETSHPATIDLSGETIAYDAMHGSGRGVTDALLESVGATVERVRCERDPSFGGEPPEPSAEHLTTLVERVRDGPATFGIANDGDADRLAVVTPERGVVNENLFFAATYDALLQADAGPAVRTVSTTFLIDRIAQAHDQRVVETPVGFKWVAQQMAESDALMGGEESGGFSVRGHVREKDGVLLALLAAVLHARESYDDRIDRLTDRHGRIVADKTSLDCPDDAKTAVIDALGDAIPDRVAGRAVTDRITVDGYKLLLADGAWVLVRPSGTEPKMRVYAESDSPDDTAELMSAVRDLVAPVVDQHR